MVRVLDRVTGTERFTVRGFPNAVLRVAVAPDGGELAAAGFDPIKETGSICRFDIGGRATDSWHFGNEDQIASVLALTPDNTKAALMVADLQGELRSRLSLCDVLSGKEGWKFQTELYSAATFCPEGPLVGVGIRRRPIELIGAAGRPTGTLDLDINVPRLRPTFAATPDGRTLYSAVNVSRRSNDPEVRLISWDLASRERAEKHGRPISPPRCRWLTRVKSMSSPPAAGSIRPAWASATVTLAYKVDGEDDRYRGVMVVWDRQSARRSFEKWSMTSCGH